MKGIKTIAALLGVGFVGGAIALLFTNPSQDAYETYATKQLQSQLDENMCQDAPAFLEGVCSSMVGNNDALLKTLVKSSTTRRNYYVLSVYETDLDPMAALDHLLPGNLSLSIGNTQGVPTYHLETIGIFGRFFTYEAERTN
ncbi:MAG: DUF4359 domain-containing protein [Symploca sp. SIO2B6]|nr:DUF4359 domain-containing protein [Symploca sp. SIO2B6]